jgi:hypothetical protein
MEHFNSFIFQRNVSRSLWLLWFDLKEWNWILNCVFLDSGKWGMLYFQFRLAEFRMQRKIYDFLFWSPSMPEKRNKRIPIQGRRSVGFILLRMTLQFAESGTDVMIYKIFSPKYLAKIFALFYSNYSLFFQKFDHNIDFGGKKLFFHRKS